MALSSMNMPHLSASLSCTIQKLSICISGRWYVFDGNFVFLQGVLPCSGDSGFLREKYSYSSVWDNSKQTMACLRQWTISPPCQKRRCCVEGKKSICYASYVAAMSSGKVCEQYEAHQLLCSCSNYVNIVGEVREIYYASF